MILRYFLSKKFGKEGLLSIESALLKNYKNSIDDYKKEIEGYAKLCSINKVDFLILNFVYELILIKMCTSVVFLDKYNKINLASNLDYEFTEAMYNLSYLGRFY